MNTDNTKNIAQSQFTTSQKLTYIEDAQHSQQWRKALEEQLISGQEINQIDTLAVKDPNLSETVTMAKYQPADSNPVSGMTLSALNRQSIVPLNNGSPMPGATLSQMPSGHHSNLKSYLRPFNGGGFYAENNMELQVKGIEQSNKTKLDSALLTPFRQILKHHWNIVRENSGIVLIYSGTELNEFACVKQALVYRELFRSAGLELSRLIYRGKPLWAAFSEAQSGQYTQQSQLLFDAEKNVFDQKI